MNLRKQFLAMALILAAVGAAPRAHALLEKQPEVNLPDKLPGELERGEMMTHQGYNLSSYRDDIAARVEAQRRPEAIALEDSKRVHEERMSEAPLGETAWTSPWLWTFFAALIVLALVGWYWMKKQQAALWEARSRAAAARTAR